MAFNTVDMRQSANRKQKKASPITSPRLLPWKRPQARVQRKTQGSQRTEVASRERQTGAAGRTEQGPQEVVSWGLALLGWLRSGCVCMCANSQSREGTSWRDSRQCKSLCTLTTLAALGTAPTRIPREQGHCKQTWELLQSRPVSEPFNRSPEQSTFCQYQNSQYQQRYQKSQCLAPDYKLPECKEEKYNSQNNQKILFAISQDTAISRGEGKKQLELSHPVHSKSSAEIQKS